MNVTKYLYNILDKLYSGDISVIDENSIKIINEATLDILKSNKINKDGVSILEISNILYNNTPMDKLPLDDGVYDLLFELYVNNKPDLKIGAPNLQFDEISDVGCNNININTPVNPIRILDMENMLYPDSLNARNESIQYTQYKPSIKPISFNSNMNNTNYISKRLTNTPHQYPELVGTLLKSKFVLNSQAIDKGVFSDPNVRTLERDFFQKHIEMGVINEDTQFSMILELKYDGVSVESEVSSYIHSARTRGDTSQNLAADLTPLLYKYPFINALGVIPDDNKFGIKFEAIINKYNLNKYNKLKNKEYKNCRTAISGLFSSSDAYKYRDLISLVPISTSLDIDRLVEVEFINEYYANNEKLTYAVISGDYKSILFQIKRFVEEAELMRTSLPFMYDGIVVSYIDTDIIQKLGRKNSINLYSEAIKFSALKTQTVVRGVEYTVGQDGSVTPMIYYDPVEFYGTIHNKSTAHSYQRFKQLNLRIGDIIDVEYVNDVMPYITKPDNSYNANNHNQIIQFTNNCPICNSILSTSKTGKTKYCDNIECQGKKIARIVNMMDKLNIKDFAEANLEKINRYSLKDILNISIEDATEIFPTDIMCNKLMNRIHELKTTPMEDYQIVGSLGFTNIAISSWKNIFKKYTLDELLLMSYDELIYNLNNVPNIGSIKAQVIAEELPYFLDDLVYISNMDNVTSHKYNNNSKKIRFTGVRDKELVDYVKKLGHDIGEGSVTKDTSMLIVPTETYESSKVETAKKYDIPIITINEFKNNLDMYL